MAQIEQKTTKINLLSSDFIIFIFYNEVIFNIWILI